MRIGRGTRGGKKEKMWKGGEEGRRGGEEDGMRRCVGGEEVRKIGGEDEGKRVLEE